jgi:RHS repeat-associated protein
MSLDFEGYPDQTDLTALGNINGFLMTGGTHSWNSINSFNQAYYTVQGQSAAWLWFNEGDGRVDFANGPVSSFSLMATTYYPSTLTAYDASNNVLAVASGGSNVLTGTMTAYRVAADAPVIDHVVWSSNPNSFGVDMFCANGSYFGIPLAQTYGTGGCNCDAPRQLFTDRPVNTATGALTEQFTDISVPAPGINFTLTRSYTSADPTSGTMGPGWTFGDNASITSEYLGVVVRSEDGQQLFFTEPASGTTYTPPQGTTTSLTGSPFTGWTFTKRDQSTLQFDVLGRLIAMKDRLGLGLTFTYSGGNLATATDAAGRVYNFSYTSGLLTEVSLSDGRNVQYGYTSGRLSSVTDLRGKSSALAYDSHGWLESITDPNQHKLFQTVYDPSSGRVTQQTDPRGKITQFAWNATTQTSTRTDPRGKTWTEVYRNNVLMSQSDPLGNTYSYGYDHQLNRASIADPRGKTTTMTYDTSGNMLTRIGPALSSASESWTYTPFNAVATYTNGRGKTTTYEYFSNELLKKRTDPLGRVTSYTWTSNGLPDTVTDPRGKVTDFGYDAAGDRTSILSPEGNLTTFGYDPFGRLTSMVDPRGNVSGANPSLYTTTYAYNEENQLTTITDPLGRVTTRAYDDVGNLASSTDADGKITALLYNADNKVTKVTDPRGAQTTSTYDDNGNLASVTSPAGTTSYTYDDDNRKATEVTPRGNVSGATVSAFTWTYTYDGNGNELTESNPTAGTTATAYDELNRPVTVTDAHGKVTTTAYDVDGNVTSTTDPLSHTTAYGYDDADQQVTMTDPLGKVTHYGYDDSGNETSETTPLGNVRKWTYNGEGRQVTDIDPRGNVIGGTPSQYTTTNTYDAAGHLKSVTDPLGHVTTYGYDQDGNLTSRIDARNNTTSYTYDVVNRLKTVTDPLSNTTTYGYDAAGDLTSRTDANTHVTNYAYDLAGRMTQKSTPIGTWNYTYDADGNQTAVETALGTSTPTAGDGTVTRSYDPLDRLTGVDYSDSTPDVSYAYDELRETGMTDNAVSGAATESYGYDNAGQLTSITRGTSAFSYSYDNDGRLTSRTVPDGRTITQAWDDDSRPTGVTSGGVTTSYTYDAAGNRTGTTFGNGDTETRTYDAAGWLSELDTKQGTSVISGHTFTRDANGNPTKIVRAYPGTQGENYTYDADNRVTSVCWASTCIPGTTAEIDYTYDGAGNRLTEKRRQSNYLGTITSTYFPGTDELKQTHKPAYGLTPAVDTNYTYDANGNQTIAGATTFNYDLANRTKSATTGSATTNYTYDGDGNRLSSTIGTSNRTYTWDKGYPLPELTTETMPTGTRKYLDDPNGDPIALTNPGTGTGSGIQYLHPNGNASIAAATDSTGARQATYNYEPFGPAKVSPTNQDNVDNPIRFASEYLDPNTTLYNLRARNYDPNTGRFNSLDPITQDFADPYVSGYIYVGDQPTVLIDPSGKCSQYDRICQALQATFKPIKDALDDAQNDVKNAVTYPFHHTVGLCANGAIGVILVVGVNGCVSLVGGKPTLSYSTFLGTGSPTASVTGGLLIGNATCLDQIRGASGSTGGSLGEGLVVGDDYSYTRDSSGNYVWSNLLSGGFGLEGVPFAEGHTGANYTWASHIF